LCAVAGCPFPPEGKSRRPLESRRQMTNPLTSVAVDPSEGERRWFLGTLATIKINGEQSG